MSSYFHKHNRFLRKSVRLGCMILGILALLTSPRSVGLAEVTSDEPFTLIWTSMDFDDNYSAAWGDVDSDGDLDLAIGGRNRVALYKNVGNWNLEPAWDVSLDAYFRYAFSLAWGDFDNDKDLDLVVGTGSYDYGCDCHVGASTLLYENISGGLRSTSLWSSPELNLAYSVAWGDMDRDGDLDLAVGNYGGNTHIYRNVGGTLKLSLYYSLTVENTTSLAWGDVENDGDLDLVVGNYAQKNRLYMNTGGTNPGFSPVWLSNELDETQALAWGDYDNDGYLDLAVGNHTQPARLYHNNQGVLSTSANWSSIEELDHNISISWGDFDNDGDLDLLTGNGTEKKTIFTDRPNRVYRNNGTTLDTTAFWSSTEVEMTISANWVDYDNDGVLDIVAVNWLQPNRIYRGNAAGQILAQDTNVFPNEWAMSVAWGDYDGDGDLDLAAGNGKYYDWNCSCYVGSPTRVYRNEGGVSPNFTQIWSAPYSENSADVHWVDYDGDGDLDLSVGNRGNPQDNTSEPLRIYRNLGGSRLFELGWTSPFTLQVVRLQIAWGDFDADGDLDFALADGDIRVYKNDGNAIPGFTLAWAPDWMYGHYAITAAWTDYDQDGDLDLATGSDVFRNDRGSLTSMPVWTSPLDEAVRAWGDIDSDGDPDLLTGDFGRPFRIFRNDGGSLAPIFNLAWSSIPANDGASGEFGDYDGDGDLDLAVGIGFHGARIYRNDGGVFTGYPVWSFEPDLWAESVAWGDYDNDGDLDLAAGNNSPYTPLRIFRNTRDRRLAAGSIPLVQVSRPTPPSNAGGYSSEYIWSQKIIPIAYNLNDINGTPVRYIRAWFSTDGGGNWQPAVAASGTLTSSLMTLNPLVRTFSRAENMPIPDNSTITSSFTVKVNDYVTDVDVFFNIQHTWDGDLVIRLRGPNGRTVTLVRNKGGGGDNFTGTILDDEATTPIISGSAPFNGRYRPDEVLSTFDGINMGGSWSLVITDVTAPDPGVLGTWGVIITTNSGRTYTYNWDVYSSGFFGQSDNVVFRFQAVPEVTNLPNQVPGPYFYGSYASQTYPFRVRGTQVKVLYGGLPASGALVYRLENGTGGAAQPISNVDNTPFYTDSTGFLQGRGEIKPGDKLAALLPVESGAGYTRYVSSAYPIPGGLNMYTVPSGLVVLPLYVYNSRQLILFNLDISLEWDARQDAQFLDQLRFDLQRASELLYDWSNGQAALGKITIYHDRLHWDTAHIRIYANNRRRPVAVLGGIVTVNTPDLDKPDLVYQPGMIHMGASWNRYGIPGTSLGDDWPRALAHELGHYALYLDDDYLGLDALGNLKSVDTCTNTAMADPYRDDYSEFKYSDKWLPGCEETLANKTTGRADWTTIHRFYPQLNYTTGNTGPSWLPLAVTQVVEESPLNPPLGLPDPRFYLKDAGGASLQPGNGARAYLVHGDRLVDLGVPAVDSIVAGGAAVGDKVCVIELGEGRTGCKVVTGGDDMQLTLADRPGWTPQVEVTPVTTRTVTVKVNGLAIGLTLRARLYSGEGQASQEIELPELNAEYSNTFNLQEPTTEGYIRIWDVGDAQHEVVTDFAMGGNPAGKYAGFAGKRAGFAGKYAGFAPGMSVDGQVIIFSDNLVFPIGQFYTLQMATVLPQPPPWANPVGYGYWLKASNNAPSLTGTSLSMGYLGRDVPAGEERFLVIYHWTAKDGWAGLPTVVDEDENMAMAVAPGEGLYALMTTVELSLVGPGWDLFSYPVLVPGPLPTTLASIEGKYSIVYGYVPEDTVDPWKMYAVGLGAYPYVNDLFELSFGEAYWIQLSESVTLRLKGGLAPKDGKLNPDATHEVDGPVNYPAPPATYFGAILPGAGFTPTVNMQVDAWSDGVNCGSALSQDYDGQVVYSLNVPADELNWPGCGAAGRLVEFRVGGELMQADAWSSDQVNHFDLQPVKRVYLPMVMK